MFKNILKFLFEEEDEEIIEDQPLEEIRITKEVEEPKPVEKVVRTQPQPAKPEAVSKPKEEPKVAVKKTTNQTVAMNQESDTKPKKRFIDFDEPQVASKTNSFTMKSETKRDYEVTPVISPIFGTKEDQQARSSMTQETTVTRVKKKNPLGTVISPMFGASELEEMEDQAQERLANEDVAYEDEKIIAFTKPAQEKIMNVPLEDLLAVEDDEVSDDVMQFSLFGGEEAIKKADEAHVYALDEDE